MQSLLQPPSEWAPAWWPAQGLCPARQRALLPCLAHLSRALVQLLARAVAQREHHWGLLRSICRRVSARARGRLGAALVARLINLWLQEPPAVRRRAPQQLLRSTQRWYWNIWVA